MTAPFYVQKLSSEFDRKQRKNSSFSLRAYARQLGVAAPVLSEVLRLKRPLPLKYAEAIATALELSPREKAAFISSIQGGLKSLAKIPVENAAFVLDEERHFRIISEWEYYAAVEVLRLPRVQYSYEWIANKLGIPIRRAQMVIESLIEEGLLIRDEKNQWKPTHKKLTSTQDIQSLALRKSHLESLEMAAQKLQTIPLSRRFYSSSTVPIDVRRLEEAKELYREFRAKLSELLKGEKPTEVYEFCFQLFPLTQSQGEKYE